MYLLLWAAAITSADGIDESQLKAKATDLVQKLGAEKAEVRSKAASELISAGPGVLNHLPNSSDKSLSPTQKTELDKLLPKLWQARVEKGLEGSWVEVPAGQYMLIDLLQKIAEATGNPVVDQREAFNEEVVNPVVAWDGKKRRFWDALNVVCSAGGVSLEHFSGENVIGVRARSEDRAGTLAVNVGACQFTPQTITLFKQLGGAEAKATVAIQAIFEPKLRPVLVEIDLADFKVIDDKGRNIPFAAGLQQTTFSFGVDESAHHFELALELASPLRDASKIKRIEGIASLHLPAVTNMFEFDDWTGKTIQEKSASNMKVACGNSKDEGDGLWSFELHITSLADVPKGESFAAAQIEPEIFLVHTDGTRVPPNAGKNVREEEGKMVIEYLTSGLPGKLADYKISARMPAGIIKAPVKFAVVDLPLP